MPILIRTVIAESWLIYIVLHLACPHSQSDHVCVREGSGRGEKAMQEKAKREEEERIAAQEKIYQVGRDLWIYIPV